MAGYVLQYRAVLVVDAYGRFSVPIKVGPWRATKVEAGADAQSSVAAQYTQFTSSDDWGVQIEERYRPA